MGEEKFYLHIEFRKDDMDLEIHAKQLHIAEAMVVLGARLQPEFLAGVINSLSHVATMPPDPSQQKDVGA